MFNLELTTEEQSLLKELLENDLTDLRMEVSDTHSAEFRQMLKQKEQVLKELLAKLASGESD